MAGATGAIGKQLAPRLAVGEVGVVGVVLMSQLRGAGNATATRAPGGSPGIQAGSGGL